MMELNVHNEQGEVTGKVTVDESLLGEKVLRRLMHQAVVMYEGNRHQGTHKTKSKAERRGSDAKPWRQKGTGRARAGDRRSPLWRKGGVVFGPQVRSYRTTMPKGARRAAMRSALLARLIAGDVRVIEPIALDEPKTKRVAAMLKANGLDSSCLIATTTPDPDFLKSVRNIPRVSLIEARNLNTYELLRPRYVVFTRDVIDNLKDVVHA